MIAEADLQDQQVYEGTCGQDRYDYPTVACWSAEFNAFLYWRSEGRWDRMPYRQEDCVADTFTPLKLADPYDVACYFSF